MDHPRTRPYPLPPRPPSTRGWVFGSAAAEAAYGDLLRDLPSLLADAEPLSAKKGAVETTYAAPRHGLIVKARGPNRHVRPVAREFRMGQRLAERGVSVLEPIAYHEGRHSAREATDYLILPYVDGAVNARRLIDEASARAAPELLRALGRVVAGLHRAGYVHGDLTLKNVIGTPSRRFFVIDLDHVRRVPPPLRFGYEIHDLRDLRISGRRTQPRFDFEELFAGYAEERGLSAVADRLCWYGIHRVPKKGEPTPEGWGRRNGG